MRTNSENEQKKSNLSTTIGERIKSERKRKGWSQIKFAKELGLYIDHSRISKWENDNETPGDDLLRRMALIFDCDYGYLIGEYPQRTRTESDIKKATGLSDKAVEAIKNADHYKGMPSMPSMEGCLNNSKKMLDLLLQDDRFHDVLMQIGHYYAGVLSLDIHNAAYQEMTNEDPTEYENACAVIFESGRIVMRPDEATEHHLYLACEKFKEIIRDFANKEREAQLENGEE